MPPPNRPTPPGADDDLPPIVDHRRAAAVALALAAAPEALAGAFVDLGLPALPRKVSVALPTDEGEAWVVFDRAGKLLSCHAPGWPPRGAVAADLKALVAARAELAGADQVGVRRVEALLRSCLDRAAELTRGEFVQVERLMPLVWGRALEIIGDTIENGLGFADTYRHIDARKRENGALLWAQWQRMQGLGHLALALHVDHEALYAVSEGPPAGGDDEAPPSPHGLMEPLLNFGLLGPYLRGVRALATLGSGFVENLLHTHQVETDYPRLREALLDLPALTAAALVDKKAAPDVIRLLEEAVAAAPPADPADPSTAALQQLTAGLLALLKSPKGERRARRAWLRDRLAQSPALTEHLGAPPPEGAVPATETTSAGESAGAEATGEDAPSETGATETSATETSADAAEKAQEAWDHRALVALLNRPVDWRVEPTLFIELVIRMLPWLAQSAPRDLYPIEPLAAVFTEPPPVTWLHQHTLLCQASGRPAPIVREAPKVGRNEPCPCGSGKKYKKCCGG